MIKIIIFISVLFFLLSCGQNRQKEKDKRIEQDTIANKIQIDISIIAILPYDISQYWIFKNAKQTDLSLTELKKVRIDVMDGGNCFFHLKVNIDKNEYYDFMVNGDA